MLLKLAWKNLWRNKLRSGIILSAITIGLIAAVFVVGFANGMISKKINDAIDIEMAHLTLNTQSYIDNQEAEDYFTDSTQFHSIGSMQRVVGVSPRTLLNVSVATAHDMGGIRLIGVSPTKEKSISALYRHIPDSMGIYLNDSLRMPILVGRKFAEKYKVRVGSKVIITLADLEGEQQSAAFRICGIFYISNPMFEQSEAFVLSHDLIRLAKLPTEAVHEIGIRTDSNDDSVVFDLRARLTPALPDNVVARTWKEMNSIVAIYTDFFGVILLIIVGIILFALGFGIINTVLMSVIERQREFNMLIAIGMRPLKVMSLVIMEGTILTCLGGFVGMFIGAISIWANSNGIDMSDSMGNYEYMGIDTMIVPIINTDQFIAISLMVVATGIIASIYPALAATKTRKQ